MPSRPALRDALLVVLKTQELAGLDVVSDGEIEEPKKGLYFGGNRPDPSKDLHHWIVLALDT
ncbi:MAG: hypothetical protein MK358_07895, partial [Vicinamibacterales bacterium]|nr:hypothetical protein [Vicinamibacterales bacterium]